MDKKYIIGLLLVVLLIFSLGLVHTGGVGTYQIQMSNDADTIAVMDTRTGIIKIFNISSGDKILSFNNEERLLDNYRRVHR
ncbi:MAG: hypothetical protein JW806_00475 [Sedimentisphaerales bacterium]|nr:hypothetical protein [Sedimentisphaerales bacterium]